MADAAWSKENLFAQLVSRRLQQSQVDRMQNSAVEPWDSPPRYFGPFVSHNGCDSDSSAWDLAGSCASCQCGPRLEKLEQDVVQLQRGIDVIISRLPEVAPMSPRRTALSSAAPLSPLRTASTIVLVSAESSPTSSPRFQFVCPLCFRPQLTPKSHCEHIRNAAAEGVHHCRFNSDHNRHARILEVWGSADCFVKWYCSFLRSGVGSKYTEGDIQHYLDLMSKLDNACLSGSYV
jgi:hypothetical protein